MKRAFAPAAALVAFAIVTVLAGRDAVPYRAPDGAGLVQGTIVVRLGSETILLPDITVRLQDATRAGALSVTTDLHGKFGIVAPEAGQYMVCWEGRGWRSDCLRDPVFVTGRVRLGTIPIEPEPGDSTRPAGVIRGDVRLGDGSVCLWTNPFFAADLNTSVTVLDDRGAVVAGPVKTNAFGEYVLAGVPPTGARIVANCEGDLAAAPIAARDGSVASDLRLLNGRPEVRWMLARLDGRIVRRVPLGATVLVEAGVRDGDNDALTFTWATHPGSGAVTPGRDATALWELPRAPGLHTLYLLLGDGRGGRVLGRLSLSVGADEVFFSGTVTSRDGSVLSGAQVSVNGATIATDARGVFKLMAPENERERYVMTIASPGFVTLSRVLHTGVGGMTWRLEPAQVFTVDPDRPIRVVENESSGARSGGVTLQIPPRALVDVGGRPARGPLQIMVATLDARRAPLPGDYTAVDQTATEHHLSSLGGAFVDIRDSAGNRYDLRTNAHARLTIPISSTQAGRAGSLPARVSAWLYEGTTGLWVETGSAERKQSDSYQLDLTKVGSGIFSIPLGPPSFPPRCLFVFGPPSASPFIVPPTLEVIDSNNQIAQFVMFESLSSSYSSPESSESQPTFFPVRLAYPLSSGNLMLRLRNQATNEVIPAQFFSAQFPAMDLFQPLPGGNTATPGRMLHRQAIPPRARLTSPTRRRPSLHREGHS